MTAVELADDVKSKVKRQVRICKWQHAYKTHLVVAYA